MQHERVLASGMLSKTTSYCVFVSGPVGEREIERLLKKLEMDKEILADEPATVADQSAALELGRHKETRDAE